MARKKDDGLDAFDRSYGKSVRKNARNAVYSGPLTTRRQDIVRRGYGGSNSTVRNADMRKKPGYESGGDDVSGPADRHRQTRKRS